MTLIAPALLAGLLVLPVLWWLLRALPPAPRVQPFPAIRLLLGLNSPTQEARRAPLWLLLLRIVAAGLLVVGLAQPVLVPDGAATADRGTLLLAIDNGWAAAPGWPARLDAARQILSRAARAGRSAVLLPTADDPSGARPALVEPSPAAAVLARLDQLHPLPWPDDREAAAHALAGASGFGSITYVSDGLATAGDAAFAAALRRLGTVTELRAGPSALAVPLAPRTQAGALQVPVSVVPQDAPRAFVLRGEAEDGETLARAELPVPAGAARGAASFALPVEIRNRITRLVVEEATGGSLGAGAVRFLDEGDRRRPVGLLSATGGETPLVGSAFFLRRALGPVAELREGTLAQLLSRQISVLIAPDGTLDGEADSRRVADWVRKGGMLIRFAGPALAARQAKMDEAAQAPAGTDEDGRDGPVDDDDAAPRAAQPAGTPGDQLLPVALLGGARQLGGAMSWGHPEHPAPFSADSPFNGLSVPEDVTVTRQVLAEPAADLASHSWARLQDGTPLVTHAALGDGQIVLFHVTSTADWSNLPLSGLFPAMLERLVQRAAGLSTPGDRTVLAPSAALTGEGALGPPPPAARGLEADRFGTAPASPEHPPGLYGPLATRRALNPADALPPLAAEAPVGALRSLADRQPDRPLGPSLLAIAILLLAIDLLATLWLRGFLSRPTPHRATLLLSLLLLPAAAIPFGPALAIGQAGAADVPRAALETRLGYILTGDPAVDDVSREGLDGLTAYANARTSAQLGQPDGVRPGQDDLAFYPMLYWPITTTAAAPSPSVVNALNAYMSHGGILLIDTQGTDASGPDGGGSEGGGFTGYKPGAGAALRRATQGLDIPALRPVDHEHVLSHSFYLLHAFPGRYVGPPVWVAREDDLGNDGVSPVIIGANDWAAAWAVDADGQTPFAVIPGGDEQRTLAYRFGVNAVIYALTGNYKTDQVHVPALLQRLGQ